jgi:transposase-like protein
MTKLNITSDNWIKDIPCVCGKKDHLKYTGHDKEKQIVECHNCFKTFTDFTELTVEALTESINKKKAKIKAEQQAKEKKGKGRKKQDAEDKNVVIDDDFDSEDEAS